jgi:hypothetical protein
MRTFFYRPLVFVSLLVVCLMFAPSRRIIGDVQVAGQPSTLSVVPKKAPDKPFADLCRDDPVGALAASLAKYKAIEGYTCTFVKRERIDGKLKDIETIACDFQESPFTVLMRWKAGIGRAEAMMYVAGENDDMLLIVPASDFQKKAVKTLTGRTYARRPLTGSDAKSAARYPANEFGMAFGTRRVYKAWQAAEQSGRLKSEYLGLVDVPELGKKCHVLRRTVNPPEEEGLTSVTVMFDPETLLQVGSVLKAGDELIGSYFFKDIVLNPKFDKAHFAVEKLK